MTKSKLRNLILIKTHLNNCLIHFKSKVAEPDLSQFNISLVDPDQVQVLTNDNYSDGVNISVGQTAWIPFVIQIPPLTVAPAQVILTSHFK